MTQFLDAKDIASKLKVHISTAYTLIQQMPHHKFGRSVRVSVEDFESWQKEKRAVVTGSLSAVTAHTGNAGSVGSDGRPSVVTARLRGRSKRNSNGPSSIPHTEPRTRRRSAVP
jgi:excisionase family DNA binding protein